MRKGAIMSELLSIAASLFMVAVVITYFLQVRDNVSTPNPATWLIWSVVSTMNCISYFSVVEGNVFKFFVTVIVAVGLSIVCIYTLRTGRFGKIGWVEIISLLLAVAVGVVWKTAGPKLANLALQVIFVISFIPTIRGLIKGELKERPRPWILAVTAYVCQVLSLLADWQGDWISLVYPVVNGIIGNGSVAAIILYQAKHQASRPQLRRMK